MNDMKPTLMMALLALLIATSGCQPTAGITPSVTDTAIPSTSTSTPTSTPTLTPDPIYLSIDGTILGANLNCPDRAAFGYLWENSPVRGATVELPFTFRWYYYPAVSSPADWSTVCVPNNYTLYLAAGPDFTDVTAYPVVSPMVEARPSDLLIRFAFNELLEPHTSYRWIIAGQAGDIGIDVEELSLFNDPAAWKMFNNESDQMGQFQTGPRCKADTIAPVNLLAPADEAVLETDTPFFQWEMPGCSNSAYHLGFDTDPQMTSVDLGWATNTEEFLMFAGRLQPCVQYYWRVQAGLYSYEYHLSQGNWSTASEIRSFIIRSSICPNAQVQPPVTPIPTKTRTPVPVYVPPPTAAPVNCTGLEKSQCEGTSACEWYDPGVEAPYCRAKP